MVTMVNDTQKVPNYSSLDEHLAGSSPSHRRQCGNKCTSSTAGHEVRKVHGEAAGRLGRVRSAGAAVG